MKLMRWICFVAMACMLCAQERETLAAVELAEKLVDSDPAASLACAKKAAGLDPFRRTWFWPVMLKAHLKLADWEAAERLGTEAVKEIDSGQLYGRPSEIGDEVRMRRLFAEALDHRGKAAEAQSQRSIAETRAKAMLLSTEINEPATSFHVKSLEGHAGKIVVVMFWATWCGPCIAELDKVSAIYATLRDRVKILAVSSDDTSDVIRDFAAKRGYAFPVLASKEHLSTIPQLFVIDREGNVRFHLTGFDDDGLFERRLDWMLTAAMK